MEDKRTEWADIRNKKIAAREVQGRQRPATSLNPTRSLASPSWKTLKRWRISGKRAERARSRTATPWPGASAHFPTKFLSQARFCLSRIVVFVPTEQAAGSGIRRIPTPFGCSHIVSTSQHPRSFYFVVLPRHISHRSFSTFSTTHFSYLAICL